MASERLQKILARAGIASRRAAEEIILEGRVTVNGRTISRLGEQADPETDHIKVDGHRINERLGGPSLYFLCFKPRQVITTLSDPEGRRTILDVVRAAGIRERVVPVGRLDWDADGLLLLTNDGDLANRVMHPRTHLPKVYDVRVKGVPDERSLDRLRRGIMLGSSRVRTLPAEIEIVATEPDRAQLRVVLVEGRQNQVKKMFEAIGHPVRRLRRLSIGPLGLGKLKPGDVRPLTAAELTRLRRALDAAAEPDPAPAERTERSAARRTSRPRAASEPDGAGRSRTPVERSIARVRQRARSEAVPSAPRTAAKSPRRPRPRA